jgi:hypothetical protein
MGECELSSVQQCLVSGGVDGLERRTGGGAADWLESSCCIPYHSQSQSAISNACPMGSASATGGRNLQHDPLNLQSGLVHQVRSLQATIVVNPPAQMSV